MIKIAEINNVKILKNILYIDDNNACNVVDLDVALPPCNSYYSFSKLIIGYENERKMPLYVQLKIHKKEVKK